MHVCVCVSNIHGNTWKLIKCSGWVYAFRVGILAFHTALSEFPRDPMAVAAFSLAVHNGGDISEAINIARKITAPQDVSFHELSEPQILDSRAMTHEVMDLAASVKSALCKMTDEHFISQAMSGYPQAPYSDMVRFFCHSFFFSFQFREIRDSTNSASPMNLRSEG